MKRLWWLVVLFSLAFATPIAAQSPALTYTLRIYSRGAAAPISPPTIMQANNFTCGQSPIPPVSTANPNRLEFDDSSAAGKVCRYTDPGTGPLLALPNIPGAYEGTLTAVVDGQESEESNRAPFVKAPRVLNFRIVK